MKTLLTSLTLLAFAFSIQAGEDKACDKNKTACADKAKATACESACASKCTGSKALTKKPVDQSVKGATLLVRR